MSDDEAGGLFFVGVMLGIVAMFAVVFIGSCDAEQHRRKQRSTEACTPALVLSADNGVAACSDGRVYRWREGYLTPVGRK